MNTEQMEIMQEVKTSKIYIFLKSDNFCVGM